MTTFQVQTRATDNTDTDHGKIRVTLMSVTPAGQIQNTPDNYAEVTVHDDSTPVISIRNITQPVFAETDAIFTLESSIAPVGGSLTIRYQPVNETGKEFLNITKDDGTTYTPSEIWETEVMFAPDPNSALDPKPIIGTIDIPTRDDPDEEEGDIVVTLQADNNDSNTPARYELANPNTPGMVNVIDVPSLALSVMAKNSVIREGGSNTSTDAVFIVSTPVDPVQPLSFKYTTTHTFTKDSENYLHSGYTAGQKTATRTFQPNDPQNPTLWTTEILIPLRPIDMVDEENGTLMIVLDTPDQDARYEVNTTNDNHRATITLIDQNIPKVSIEAAPETVAGLNANFILVSDIQPRKAIMVDFSPSASENNFLDTSVLPLDLSKVTSAAITFAQDPLDNNRIKGILPVLTKDDPNHPSGKISVELLDDESPQDYTIVGNNAPTNTVESTVIDPPDVTLSIAYNGSTINEGETATFVVSTTTNPRRPIININYTPTDSVGSNFLDPDKDAFGASLSPPVESGDMRGPIALEFTKVPGQDIWNADLKVYTRDIAGDQDHGTITVLLESNTNDFYTVSNLPSENSDSVSINDNDVPTIEILRTSEALAGDDAEIVLMADFVPWEPIDIRYTPTIVTGNFIESAVSNNEQIAMNVEFTRDNTSDPYTAILPVPTINDPVAEAGSFTVILNVDPNTDQQYQLPSDTSKTMTTVSIIDPPEPELTIESSKTVQEGSAAVLTITANADPKRELDISYTIVEATGNYLQLTADEISAKRRPNDWNQSISIFFIHATSH